MENYEKAINLFSFIKGINEIKKETVTNIDKQKWSLSLKDIFIDKKYVELFYRDRTSDDEVDDNMTILSVKKPDLPQCPQPNLALKQWLTPGWDDFKKDSNHLNEIETENEDGTLSTIKFNNDPNLSYLYEKWVLQREDWVRESERLNKIKSLFSSLVLKHIELEANSETEEMIVANGFLLDKHNKEINHPVLTRRVKTVFDEEENIIYIVDTDNNSELYVPLLRSMDNINHESISKLNSVLLSEDYHPLDRIDTPLFLKTLIHSISSESLFSESEMVDSWRYNNDFLLYLNPVLIIRKKLDGSAKALEAIIENIKETKYVPGHILDLINGGKVEMTETLNEETIEQKLAAASGEDVDIFLSKETNREQLEIAQRINNFNAVLVQGPPGTGKTHTIANLLGHFLAQGKTVLITSHTSKALRVLKDKIRQEVRDLCVSVLDESNKDMEKSIDGITEHMSFSSSKYKKQMDSKFSEREHIINRLAKTRKKNL